MRVLRPMGSAGLIQMKLHGGKRRAQGWLLAGLTLASCAYFLPSTSSAGCSHYVTTEADATRFSPSYLDLFVSVGTLENASSRGLPVDKRPTSPCTGLHCSGDSSVPVSVPQAVPRIDFWACVQLGAEMLRPNSSPLPNDDHSSRPLDQVDRLTRPPR
jgi:hypothetical protein